MPYEEFINWNHYFERRPVEWRADLRAARIINSQGVDKKPQELFQTLVPIFNPPFRKQFEEGEIDLDNLKRSSFFQQLVLAGGGDKLDL